jgi:hypothetical protein
MPIALCRRKGTQNASKKIKINKVVIKYYIWSPVTMAALKEETQIKYV